MVIRTIKKGDAPSFWNMLCKLDEETSFMLYEPGERRKNANSQAILKNNIDSAMKAGDLVVVAVEEEEIIGFLWANKGQLHRTSHTAYIVIGIRKAYQNKGIGKKLMSELDEWAKKNSVVRLELTVETINKTAKHLYEKYGFTVEGLREKSMFVNGEFIDEYYMAKIIK